MQGARRGTWSRASRITPRAEGSAKLLSHPGCPNYGILIASKLGVNFQSFISYLFFNNSILVGIENLRTEKLLKKMLTHALLIHIIFLRFYLFIRRDRERERERGGEAGPIQGARCGTRPWVSRITPQAAGGAKLLHHGGCPT